MTTEVQVLYFARSADLTGLRTEKIHVRAELTSIQLWEILEKRHPRLSVLREQVVLAVREEYVKLGEEPLTLQPGDEVAVIPPISGDVRDMNEEAQDHVSITHHRLSVQAVSDAVFCPSCGAVSLFIGTTRNTFEGKKVVQLEYEAYVSMAESELRKIFTDIRKRWPSIKHICVHHRLGIVPVTEASVIIGISSPHRRDSLEAVQFCIDELKATVPIWKKEVYEDEGSAWKENRECLWTGTGMK